MRIDEVRSLSLPLRTLALRNAARDQAPSFLASRSFLRIPAYSRLVTGGHSAYPAMPPPLAQDVRLPPLRYIIGGLLTFSVLALLSAREHSDKFSSSSSGSSSDVRLDPVTGAYIPSRKVVNDELASGTVSPLAAPLAPFVSVFTS